MAKLGTITLTGVSGASYTFNIYPWGTSFRAVAAVYAVTKRYTDSKRGHTHTVLYVGQTEDLSTRFDNHHKAACFTRNGANCICTDPEESESTRREVETDLIESYKPRCNA